jgi:hypothetical protein
LYTVKEKGGKPDIKPYPLPYGLRNPYRNLMSENFQNYAQKPQRNCTFMNSASVLSYSARLKMYHIIFYRHYLNGWKISTSLLLGPTGYHAKRTASFARMDYLLLQGEKK